MLKNRSQKLHAPVFFVFGFFEIFNDLIFDPGIGQAQLGVTRIGGDHRLAVRRYAEVIHVGFGKTLGSC